MVRSDQPRPLQGIEEISPLASQDLEPSRDPVLPGEELKGLAYGEVQHLVDGASPPLHLEDGRTVATSAAGLADEVGIGEELQVDPHPAVATAPFAAPPPAC